MGDMMTSTVANLTEDNNRFLNLIKAHMGLKNKSDAINFVVEKYAEEAKEPELRPEFVRRMKRIMKEKTTRYSSVREMMKSFE